MSRIKEALINSGQYARRFDAEYWHQLRKQDLQRQMQEEYQNQINNPKAKKQ